ncbi:hypothetical protein CEXT_679921 [Caerostris extrusa]|uniref:Uncharacterized protein n=1 Tax=Caerostris extrusa TaxID=172846 RepID=A0AAV4PX90_CAEEX|nr:hypothetical protein CEXT_679921 [Caerostris extrusa]
METAEDEWWRRMGVLRRWTTPFGNVHQDRVIRNLWRQRVRQYNRRGWPRLISRKPIQFITDEEHCGRIYYSDQDEGPCTEFTKHMLQR